MVAVRSALGLIGNVPTWDTGAWLHAKGIEIYAIVTVFGTQYVWELVRRSLGELFRPSVHLSAEAGHTAGAVAQSLPAAAGHGGGHWVGLAHAALMVWAAIALRQRAAEA